MDPAGDGRDSARRGRGARLAALGVHVFTASGAVLGLLALLAASRADFAEMFAWLSVALLVDGIDGTLARKAHVRETLPGFSGDTLDLVVDYVTYVLVPAYALVRSGLMPDALGLVAGAAICLSAALYFASTSMKTDDWFFRGFPAIWNVVVFYLFLLEPAPAVTFAIVAILAGLTFAPIAFVHPMRVRRLRPLTLSLLAVWSALACWAIWKNLAPEGFVIWALLALALYFSGLGLSRSRSEAGKGN